MQEEDFGDMSPQEAATMILAQHTKMTMSLIPSFIETIDENGGWDRFTQKGRH
jgi:hypothetical protein